MVSEDTWERIASEWETATNDGGGAFTYDPVSLEELGGLDAAIRQLEAETYAAQKATNRLRGLTKRAERLKAEEADGA